MNFFKNIGSFLKENLSGNEKRNEKLKEIKEGNEELNRNINNIKSDIQSKLQELNFQSNFQNLIGEFFDENGDISEEKIRNSKNIFSEGGIFQEVFLLKNEIKGFFNGVGVNIGDYSESKNILEKISDFNKIVFKINDENISALGLSKENIDNSDAGDNIIETFKNKTEEFTNIGKDVLGTDGNNINEIQNKIENNIEEHSKVSEKIRKVRKNIRLTIGGILTASIVGTGGVGYGYFSGNEKDKNFSDNKTTTIKQSENIPDTIITYGNITNDTLASAIKKAKNIPTDVENEKQGVIKVEKLNIDKDFIKNIYSNRLNEFEKNKEDVNNIGIYGDSLVNIYIDSINSKDSTNYNASFESLDDKKSFIRKVKKAIGINMNKDQDYFGPSSFKALKKEVFKK